jgi:hypothetical protein
VKISWQFYRTGGWRPLLGWVRSPSTIVVRAGVFGRRLTVLLRFHGSR